MLSEHRTQSPAPSPGGLPAPSSETMMGALVGWIRNPSGMGAVVRIQAARSRSEATAGRIDEYLLGLTAQQMRLFGRDLIRGADMIEGRASDEPTRKRWWR